MDEIKQALLKEFERLMALPDPIDEVIVDHDEYGWEEEYISEGEKI